MKLLLNESVNVRLRHSFTDHDARTVDYMRWKGIGNGELLVLVRQEFDVFITRDREISNRQNITTEEIPIIVLHARSNRMKDLEPLVPRILETLFNIKRGEVVRIYP